MKPVVSMSLALAFVAAAAAPALACGDKDGQASFPMKADAFQQHVDAKIAHVREKVEARLKEKQATSDQARAERSRMDAVAAKIQVAVKKATADGTVTKEEADAVRKISKELRGQKKDGGTRS